MTFFKSHLLIVSDYLRHIYAVMSQILKPTGPHLWLVQNIPCEKEVCFKILKVYIF